MLTAGPTSNINPKGEPLENTFLNKKRENPNPSNPLANAFSKVITNDKGEIFDQDKIMKAVTKEQERRQRDSEILKNEKMKKGKGVGNMAKDDDSVTAEDMEAYRLMKTHFDDPMKNMK